MILNNFTDVWATHVNDMAMYHAFVLPMEDFERVFNYKTPTSDTMPTESVKGYLQDAYGVHPEQYIKQLMTDLNGGARIDRACRIFMERNPQYTDYEEVKQLILESGSVKKAEEKLHLLGAVHIVPPTGIIL